MSEETNDANAAPATLPLTPDELSTLGRHEPAQFTLDYVNTLLETTTAEGGYAMGVVCATCWARRAEPKFTELDIASRATKMPRS